MGSRVGTNPEFCGQCCKDVITNPVGCCPDCGIFLDYDAEKKDKEEEEGENELRDSFKGNLFNRYR